MLLLRKKRNDKYVGHFQCSGLVQFNTELARKEKKKKKERETTKGLIEEVEDEKREFKVMGIKHNL